MAIVISEAAALERAGEALSPLEQLIAMKVGVARSSLLSCLFLVFVAEASHSRADDVAQQPAAALAENDDRPDADFKLIRGRVVDDHVSRAKTVDVKGADLLELIVEDAGDGNNGDWGVWLNPQIER